MSATATYVYAVGRGIPEDVVHHLRGVGDTPVRVLAVGTLTAVVGDVDRDEFEAQALAEHREDLAWLTTTARAHHSVVDKVGRDHVIAPLSLATVYFSDERVGEVLTSRLGTFDHVLEHLAGRSEWGVKAYARPVVPTGRGGDGERPASGAEYLRQRRRALRRTDTSIEEAVAAAEEVHAALAALAVDVRRHRLQDAALTGEPDKMVLNGAYLVPVAASGEFTALAGAFADRPGLRVELTGPWVPYSFAQVGAT